MRYEDKLRRLAKIIEVGGTLDKQDAIDVSTALRWAAMMAANSAQVTRVDWDDVKDAVK